MKLPNWQQQLVDYLVEMRTNGAALYEEHGGMACARFVSDAILAQTGEDFHEKFVPKGSYNGLAGSIKAVRATGCSNLAELAGTYLPIVQPSMAHYGDVAAFEAKLPNAEVVELSGDSDRIPVELMYGLGVCEPPYIWVLTPRGLGRMRLLDPTVASAFRVG